jgi:uncharacterized metal-binding protein (TIGR02443 family)
MSDAVRRQFIAGVQCPECGALDRVQRCTGGEELWMECVACGMVRYPDEAPDDHANNDQAGKDTIVRLKPQ